jgi:hypothetical protein
MQPRPVRDLLHPERRARIAEQVEYAGPALAERWSGVGREQRLQIHGHILHQIS